MKSLLTMLMSLSLLSAANLSDQIGSLSKTLFADSSLARESSIAVLPFETTEKVSDGDLGIAIAEFLIADIVNDKKMTIVDRSRLTAILEEQNFSASEMVDQTQAIEMGKMLAANYIVTGKIVKTMGSYLVSAQMIDTKTSQIRGAAKMTLPVNGTEQAVKELYTPENYVSGSLFRSLLIPGWGQSFAEKPSHAILFGSLCGAGLIGSVATGIIQRNSYNDYSNYTELGQYPETIVAERDRIMDSLGLSGDSGEDRADEIYKEIQADKYDDYSNKNKLFTIATVATGTIWAVNVIDAMILGKKAEGKVRLYFSANPLSETYSAQFALSF